MKITTKTGDRGETSLFRGKRVSKASVFIELVGQLDELQSYVGWARCAIVDGDAGDEASAGMADEASAGMAASVVAILDRVQDDLYRMMSIVGSGMKCPDNVMTISEEDVEFLEKYIVEAQDSVKDLSKFIRPGSTEAAARLHICRTVCRRVERRMVATVMDGAGLEEAVGAQEAIGLAQELRGRQDGEVASVMLRYLNRLSDLLFVLGYKFEKK